MVHIDKLGELEKDDEFPWFTSERIEIPFLAGERLRFVLERVETDERPEEFTAAIARFLAMTTRDRDHAAPYVFAVYRENLDSFVDEASAPQIASPDEVWEHVEATEIRVSRRHCGDKKVYVELKAECDWEEEHGLQLVYREGFQLCRVSEQDGHLTNTEAHGAPATDDRIVWTYSSNE
jgi:hypothetical protein